MSEYLLEMRKFSIAIGNRSILHSISFGVRAGECIALIGSSGSGKSMMAKAILQLLPQAATCLGEIIWKNKLFKNYSKRQFRSLLGKEISLIFQNSGEALNPTRKIGCQIAEIYREHSPLISNAEIKQKIFSLLEEVDLPFSLYKQYPHHLSGGMQQRVCIAMALAMSPSLLIADEPTTSLDPILQKQILHLLQVLQKKRSMSILFITHDLRLIANFCSRALILHKGEIVESARVKDLFTNPRHPFTIKLIQSIPKLPKELPITTLVTTP